MNKKGALFGENTVNKDEIYFLYVMFHGKTSTYENFIFLPPFTKVNVAELQLLRSVFFTKNLKFD